MSKNLVKQIKNKIYANIDTTPENIAYYFKTGPGEYAEHEQFLGVRTPTLRKIAKEYISISFNEIYLLLQSPYNEERAFALIILVNQYQQDGKNNKKAIFDFYLENADRINNWNLVDISAHHIVGCYLLDKKRSLLKKLAQSKDMWERRIAIVATWTFIKHLDFNDTQELTSILLYDDEDLIHKACGWMLRELGKKDESVLIAYLEKNCKHMPRTMLRYAIEKLTPSKKRKFMYAQ